MIYGNTIGNVPTMTPSAGAPFKPQGGVGYEGPYWIGNPPPYNPNQASQAQSQAPTTPAYMQSSPEVDRINSEFAAKGTFGSPAHLAALGQIRAGLPNTGKPVANPYLYFGRGA